MLNWFYKWRLWGYSFVCEVLPQSHRDKPCAQSARRQRPCCRPLRRCVSSSKMNVPLTQVALVARPCAPAAQLTDDSSSSSRRLAISLCPLSRPLDIEQDCSFRISREKFIMPRWSPSDKLISYKIKNAIFQTPRNQLSAGCAPWFWKLWGERAQRSENFQKN